MEITKKFEELLKAEDDCISELRNKRLASLAKVSGFEMTLNAFNGQATASFREQIQNEIDAETSVSKNLETQILEAEGRKAGIEKSRKLFLKPARDKTKNLKANSELASVRDHIRKAGKPLSVDEILVALGKPDDKKKFDSLRGTLRWYAKEGRVFVNEGTNIFGLLEFQKE